MKKPSRRSKATFTLESLEQRTLLSFTSAPLRGVTPPAAYDDSSLLVGFRNPAPTSQTLAVMNQFGVSIVNRFDSGATLLSKPASVPLDNVLVAMRGRNDVIFAEPNYEVRALATPNDPRYLAGDMWGLNNPATDVDINAPQAWDITTGNSRTRIAVIDTGTDYTHPDLYLNIALNQGEIPAAKRASAIDVNADGLIDFVDLNNPSNTGLASDLNGNGYIDGGDLLRDNTWADGINQDGNSVGGTQLIDDLVGWNFNSNTNDPRGFDHGSHVSGTISARGNNGSGVTGVNWQSRILPIQVLGAFSGSTSAIVAGIDYGANMGARVMNASLGGYGFSSAMYNSIQRAGTTGLGMVLVAAAANDSNNNDGSFSAYPASYDLPNIIAVAAVGRNGQLAPYSNYGKTTVDIAAPGGDQSFRYTDGILSTIPGGRYDYYQGTSMASPHVAGVVGLLVAQDPNRTADELIQRILLTAKLIPGLDNYVATGGMVDAYAALSAASLQITPPTVRASAPGVVRITWSGPSQANRYAIERGTSPTGNFTPVTLSGVGDQFPNTVTNTGLTANRQFYYRLRVGQSVSNAVPVSTFGPVTTPQFFEAFDNSNLPGAPAVPNGWNAASGAWRQARGVLTQSSNVGTPVNKILLPTNGLTINQEITAKVRVNSMPASDFPSVGVGLMSDGVGTGYDMVFTIARDGTRRVQFLNNLTTWGQPFNFAWKTGTWYWMKMRFVNGKLEGKVWEDGANEPATYAFVQRTGISVPGWPTNTSGSPSLNGGSNSAVQSFFFSRPAPTASFDEVSTRNVTASGAATAASVANRAKALQVATSRNPNRPANFGSLTTRPVTQPSLTSYSLLDNRSTRPRG